MCAHDQIGLGGYALGIAEPRESQEIGHHLQTCPGCRECLAELTEMRELLDSVPAEALLDGEIEDNDLLFARILHQARGQVIAEDTVPATTQAGRSSSRRPRRVMLTAAAAAVVVVAGGVFAGGVVTGLRSTASVPSVASAPATAQPGTVTAHDPATGVGMTMSLTPGTGWVALQGRFSGVTPGSPCRIFVVTRSGQRIIAGAWVAPADARTATVVVNGSAIVSPQDIASVEVDTAAGQRLVAAPV